MRRPSLLAWLGALGPPAAWAVQHIGGYAAGLAGCPDNTAGPGWSVATHAWTLAIGAGAALVAAGCGLAAVLAWRATAGVDDADAPPAGRIHFLALIGMTAAPLFVAMILMSSAGALATDGCVQS